MVVEFDYTDQEQREAAEVMRQSRSSGIAALHRLLASLVAGGAALGIYALGAWAFHQRQNLIARDVAYLAALTAILVLVEVFALRMLLGQRMTDAQMAGQIRSTAIFRIAMYSIMLVLMLCGLAYVCIQYAPVASSRSARTRPMDPGAGLLISGVTLIGIFVLMLRIRRAMFRLRMVSAVRSAQTKRLSTRRRLTATAQGLVVETGAWRRETPWTFVRAYAESERLVFIYFADGTRGVIPRRVLSESDLHELRWLVYNNVQPMPGMPPAPGMT